MVRREYTQYDISHVFLNRSLWAANGFVEYVYVDYMYVMCGWKTWSLERPGLARRPCSHRQSERISASNSSFLHLRVRLSLTPACACLIGHLSVPLRTVVSDPTAHRPTPLNWLP